MACSTLWRLLRRLLAAVALVTLSACAPPQGQNGNDGGGANDNDGAAGAIDPDMPPVTEGDWFRPTVDTTWQWQLQPDEAGEVSTVYDVDVYDLDLFEAPDETIAELHAAGRRVVCYFSAGSYEDFRPDADQFAERDLGEPLGDFPDERWLDIRSESVRLIVLARLDLAAARGCDGVEPDNVDGFANESGFDLTAADQLAFNRLIANEAHRRGLSVGLKNDLDQVPQLEAYFDFSVNEQCHEYDECGLLAPFIEAGKPVFNAEYDAPYVNNDAAREALCEDALRGGLRTLVLPLDLDDAFRWSCDAGRRRSSRDEEG